MAQHRRFLLRLAIASLIHSDINTLVRIRRLNASIYGRGSQSGMASVGNDSGLPKDNGYCDSRDIYGSEQHNSANMAHGHRSTMDRSRCVPRILRQLAVSFSNLRGNQFQQRHSQFSDKSGESEQQLDGESNHCRAGSDDGSPAGPVATWTYNLMNRSSLSRV